jgi:uncharacterized protein involved in type VI secretion and phage assembly
MMNLERIVADLVERVEHRYYGKYRGTVVDNQDPARLGRLKLKVPSVLGSDVVTGWATPCAPYGGATGQGFLFIPEVGAGVWTEFEEGDLEFPIWVGTFWSQPDAETEIPKPNQGSDGTEESSVQDPPTRKIIKTLKGHTLQFEDKDGEEMVMIKEAKNGHLITLDKDGIRITDGTNGNSISMDKNGVVCEDQNQNRIEMTASAINIYPASQCNLGSAAINMVNNLPACLFTGAPHAMDAKGHAKILK